MLQRIMQYFNQKRKLNNRGSVLSVTLIILVVLAAAGAAITQLTINQSSNTTNKLSSVNDEITGKMLIEQAISEFEVFMETYQDFDDYETNEIPLVLTEYNITVTNMTGSPGFENFGVGTEGESRAYKFSYPLQSNKDLIKYAYVSTSGSTVENYNPFDFSMGTNGDLILSSGYYRDAGLYGDSIYFNKVAPYIEKRFGGTVLDPELTPEGSSVYPDFNGSGNSADVYFETSYEYCTGTCFTVDEIDDPFVIDKSLYVDIEGSGLETGVISDTVIVDFFGGFDYDQTVIDFVKDIGPTDSDTINDAMTISTLEAVVLANSSPGTEVCFWIWCWMEPSDDPYTDITTDPYFTPLTSEEYIWQGSVYNGDLVVQESLHMVDTDDEALVVIGDLTFNNSGTIYVDGKFVVTGNLYFTGDEIDVDGAFYVLGETYFQFNEGEGFSEAGSGQDYGVTFMCKDNLIIESMWESHTSSQLPDEFDAFIYTEESIFIDAVNSRVNMNGVLFAAAKGVSGNTIFMEDESMNPIHGIVVNSYRGYINDSGNAVPSNPTNRNAFYLDVINSQSLQDDFVEIPDFDSIVVTDGVFAFETSEFSYEYN